MIILSNDVFRKSDCMALNEKMIMNLKKCWLKRSWLNFKYCKELGFEGLSETTKIAVSIANLLT
jgi:hypothetical protein